jgi:hypothetical protein
VRFGGILIHHAPDESGIERTPVDSDSDRLIIFNGDVDDLPEIFVLFPADTYVTGVNAILGQLSCTFRVFREKLVPVVVKVSDNWNGNAVIFYPLDDIGYRLRRLLCVYCNAHQFGPGIDERTNLPRRTDGIFGVRVRHRLDDDRRAAPNRDTADIHLGRLPSCSSHPPVSFLELERHNTYGCKK